MTSCLWRIATCSSSSDTTASERPRNIWQLVPSVPLVSQLLPPIDRALGCLDPQCSLCQHNPSRRCVVNFDRKYLVHDMLKARCGACIRIELIDRNTGLPIEEEIPDLKLEVRAWERACMGLGYAWNSVWVLAWALGTDSWGRACRMVGFW